MKFCVVCHKNPPELPDRNVIGRPINRVCRECHMMRLRGDMIQLLKVEQKKRNSLV